MRSLRLVPALVLFALNAVANVVPAKPSAPASGEEVRKQLAAFFAGGGVGDLKKSPGTLQEVQKRIATMSADELAHFQKFIADTPDWRNMPKTMAAAIPPDVMKNLERAGADFTARVPGAERMRDDIRTLTTVLRVLPDAKLKELGIDRQMLDSLDGTFAGLSPLQAAMLQKQMLEISGWNATSASAMAALPPAMRQGASALAKHGPLTDADRKELEQFRTDLVELLGKVHKLPAPMVTSVVPERLQQQIDHIEAVKPEVLFMIRHQLPAADLATLREKVAILDRAAHLTASERAALETFRVDVADTFTHLQPVGTPDDFARNKIAQLSPEHLLILQDKLAAVPEWKEMLPLYYRAISAPDFSARMAAVRGPAPDAAHLSELNAFRAQELQYIQAASGEEGVDAALVQRASKAVAGADPVRLELIRSLAAQMDGLGPRVRLSVIAQVNFNCDVETAFGDFSLDFICNPIENAIESAIEELEDIIDEVEEQLESAIHAVESTVNTLVEGIIEVVDDIWTFVHTIPDLAWDAIEEALGDLLDIEIADNLTLRQLLQSTTIPSAISRIRRVFEMQSSTWWTAIEDVTLPNIPCPAAGTPTPFGPVGSGDAVTKYNRYKFFLGKIIGLIPDTEVSLSVKIPVQVLYAAYEFLGICLTDAAKDASSAAAEVRHTTVTTGIGSLSTQVATTTSALSVQLTNTYDALIAHGNAQTNTVTSAIAATGAALSSQLTSSTAQLTNQVDETTTALSNQVEAEATAQRSLDLRLQIELNLQAGEGKALAMFQLPEIQGGYLELVRDTVDNAMTSMLAAGQSVNQAQRYFTDAQTAISQGRYKDAFKFLQTAYREVAK